MRDGTATRPNIIYVHSHDTGRYVSPYGFALDTPNFERLASEGILFRQAFTAGPTCSPSRAALLTGQCPHSSGMLGLAHRGFTLNDPAQHIATTLRDNGYRTALGGVQHVTRNDPAELGYDEVLPAGGNTVAHAAPVAADFIRLQANADGPFFLDIGFVETHRIFPPVDPGQGRYTRPPAPLPDAPETRYDMAAYGAIVHELDRGLGMVLEAVEESGLAGSTLVISTTDHGIAFPLMKCNVTDHGAGVLLIMRGPGGFEGGRVSDALISQVDLFPTICELLEIDPPGWLQGTSIMPVVRGGAEQVNEQVYTEVTYHAAYEPQRAVRTPRWLYVKRFGDRELPVLPNCDDGESRDFMLSQGWAERPIAFEQLYDCLYDPNQANNVVDDPALGEVVIDLRGRLDAWMERTADPLLDGPVPLPVGAATNDPSAHSFLDEFLIANRDGTLRREPNPRSLR